MALQNFVAIGDIISDSFLLNPVASVEQTRDAIAAKGFSHQFDYTDCDNTYQFINAVHRGELVLVDKWTIAAGYISFRNECDAVAARLVMA